mmetsp:Transcript_16777/g.49348  ORF Transcript_16777/g.49348 Transcript_16777/m.49348 type:complete len:542 (-) Transcript_16777:84-1709(-)
MQCSKYAVNPCCRLHSVMVARALLKLFANAVYPLRKLIIERKTSPTVAADDHAAYRSSSCSSNSWLMAASESSSWKITLAWAREIWTFGTPFLVNSKPREPRRLGRRCSGGKSAARRSGSAKTSSSIRSTLTYDRSVSRISVTISSRFSALAFHSSSCFLSTASSLAMSDRRDGDAASAAPAAGPSAAAAPSAVPSAAASAPPPPPPADAVLFRNELRADASGTSLGDPGTGASEAEEADAPSPVHGWSTSIEGRLPDCPVPSNFLNKVGRGDADAACLPLPLKAAGRGSEDGERSSAPWGGGEGGESIALTGAGSNSSTPSASISSRAVLRVSMIRSYSFCVMTPDRRLWSNSDSMNCAEVMEADEHRESVRKLAAPADVRAAAAAADRPSHEAPAPGAVVLMCVATAHPSADSLVPLGAMGANIVVAAGATAAAAAPPPRAVAPSAASSSSSARISSGKATKLCGTNPRLVPSAVRTSHHFLVGSASITTNRSPSFSDSSALRCASKSKRAIASRWDIAALQDEGDDAEAVDLKVCQRG